MQNISDEIDYAFRADNEDNYPGLDHRFHQSFISFSENRLLGSVYDPISLKLRALAKNNLVKKMVHEVSHSEHLQIAQSVGR
jgi:DNA-binding GntR family transcriptional regulator